MKTKTTKVTKKPKVVMFTQAEVDAMLLAKETVMMKIEERRIEARDEIINLNNKRIDSLHEQLDKRVFISWAIALVSFSIIVVILS